MLILDSGEHPNASDRATVHRAHTIPTAFRVVLRAAISRVHGMCVFQALSAQYYRLVLPARDVLVGELRSQDARQRAELDRFVVTRATTIRAGLQVLKWLFREQRRYEVQAPRHFFQIGGQDRL